MSSKFKPALATNLHGDNYQPFNGGTFAVGFEYEGARYHIWFKNGRDGEVLYKNCPVALKRGDAGYYEPRKLDLSKPFGLAVLNWIEPHFGALTAQAKAQYDAGAAAEQAAGEEVRRTERIRDAAPDLLAALEDAAAKLQMILDLHPVAIGNLHCGTHGSLQRARAALAKAGV
jgi:hypothetical protein